MREVMGQIVRSRAARSARRRRSPLLVLGCHGWGAFRAPLAGPVQEKVEDGPAPEQSDADVHVNNDEGECG